MALNSLVIVEFGAQKQRISLNADSSYKEICDHIYSLFKLDTSKLKYILQRQDSFKPGLFINIDERSFINDLKHNATSNNKSSVIRLRLVPASSKDSVNKDETNRSFFMNVFFFFKKIVQSSK
jgi:hypothetical protein